MKSYLITTNYWDYDLYDSCVVVAETKERALEIAREKLFKEYQELEIEVMDLKNEGIIISSFNAG